VAGIPTIHNIYTLIHFLSKKIKMVLNIINVINHTKCCTTVDVQNYNTS